nr:sulfite exporter TauE/SafE family protein [Desulfobulbaceae bacterium]
MPDPAGLFVLGMAYGLTVCSLSCLPYLAPYLMGTGTGFNAGIINSICFMSGKLFVYATLGGVAAFIGHSINFGQTSSTIMGLIIIGAGLSMPFVNRNRCQKKCPTKAKNVSMLALGIGSSLMPCPPLAAIFTLAAQRGSVTQGVLYGLVYGLGLILSPLIIAGGGVAFVSSAIRQKLGKQMKYIEGLAMLIMVSMGLTIIFA